VNTCAFSTSSLDTHTEVTASPASADTSYIGPLFAANKAEDLIEHLIFVKSAAIIKLLLLRAFLVALAFASALAATFALAVS
jgi:hypothetical protein